MARGAIIGGWKPRDRRERECGRRFHHTHAGPRGGRPMCPLKRKTERKFKIAKSLTIRIRGLDANDVEQALDEVRKKVREGYLSGFDSNDTGRFQFDIRDVWWRPR